MMRFRLALPAAVILISVAACSSQPTAPVREGVGSLRREGGFGLGSGNRTDSTGTNTASGQTGNAAGGFGLGSGN